MVTIGIDKTVQGSYNEGMYHDIRCLSTDTKPTNVPNGSTCIEINTGKLFMFDADSSTWKEV